MTASILTAVGLRELIAGTPEDYLARGVQLAGDLDKLAQMRRTMRNRMLGSPLCEARIFTRSLEEAYRSMWQRWCAQAPSDRLVLESIHIGGAIADKRIGPSPAQVAKPKLPTDFALYPHVLRKSALVDKLIFWVRGTRTQKSQQWLRLVTLSPVRLSVRQGVCATPASSTFFRQDMRNFLLRFFSRKGSADRFVLPDGNWVEKDGSSRSNVLLAWSEEVAPLDLKRVTDLWPEHEECQQLGPRLAVLVGVG